MKMWPTDPSTLSSTVQSFLSQLIVLVEETTMEGGSIVTMWLDMCRSLEYKVQQPGAHFYGLVALRNGCQAPFPESHRGIGAY